MGEESGRGSIVEPTGADHSGAESGAVRVVDEGGVGSIETIHGKCVVASLMPCAHRSGGSGGVGDELVKRRGDDQSGGLSIGEIDVSLIDCPKGSDVCKAHAVADH